MNEVPENESPPSAQHEQRSSGHWQFLWFFPHLLLVYAIAKFVAPWAAGWVQRVLVQLEVIPPSGGFGFFFSHILAFNFLPAFLTGLVNARFRHDAAKYVWLIPAAVLAYKFATFQTSTSVLVHGYSFSAAFHQYFENNFSTPQFSDWKEFWAFVGGNADMLRGMVQATVTAPFYAGVGYCAAVWIGLRTQLNKKLAEKYKAWEEQRFRHHDEVQ